MQGHFQVTLTPEDQEKSRPEIGKGRISRGF